MKANAKQNASDYIMDHYPTDNEDLSPTEIVDKDPATQEDDDFATQKEKDYDPPPKSPQGDLLQGGARNSMVLCQDLAQVKMRNLSLS